MTIAAVDIGSNATRLTISKLPTKRNYHVLGDQIEKLRFPCRLGNDVFKHQKISSEKAKEMHEVFSQIKNTITKHKVQKTIVAATSAFRDALNGPQLLQELSTKFSLPSKILSGFEEALYMSKGLERRGLFGPEHSHLHIDIGGGSLELSLFEEEKFTFQESLDVGALRLVEDTKTGALKSNFKDQLNLIDSLLKTKNSLTQFKNKKLKLYGTGGNFKRLGKLKLESLKLEDESFFSTEEAFSMLKLFKQHPGQELCKITSIKPDNAALIVPSLMIVERVLNFWPAERIEVPDLSLSYTLLDALI